MTDDNRRDDGPTDPNAIRKDDLTPPRGVVRDEQRPAVDPRRSPLGGPRSNSIFEEDDETPENPDDVDLAGRGRVGDDRDAERGISPVGGGVMQSNGAKIAAVVAMLAIGAVAISMTYKKGPVTNPDIAANESAVQNSRYEETLKGGPPPPPTLPGEEAVLGADGSIPSQGQDGRMISGEAPPVDPRIKLLEDARRAPIMALTTDGQSGGMGSVTGGASQTGGGLVSALVGGASGDEKPNELDTLGSATRIGNSRAAMLPNRNYLVTAGTQIPCSLQTAMDSSTPGFVSCIVNNDVFSDNGNVVLMEKGTRVLGEYRGALRQGQNRLFVVWNRAVTPRGVSVNLASPAADSLGRAGMGGDIETFFWARFGGALMLSIVDDGMALATREYRDARNSINSPSQAASVALENSINIPPRLRKNQGTNVTIFAANDFDFSGVYGLRPRS